MPPENSLRTRIRARVATGEIEVHGDKYRVLAPEEIESARQLRAEEEAARKAQQQQATARQQASDNRRRSHAFWCASQVPPLYRDAWMGSLDPAILPAGYVAAAGLLRGLLTTPGIWAMVGPRGPGKTWLACAIIREMCLSGRTAMYETTAGVFKAIKSTFGVKQRGADTEADITDALAKPDLLVLDEAQLRSETPFENVILTSLIDTRYSHLKSTLLIANLEPKELAGCLGESVMSRMQETGQIIPCNWPSLRKGNADAKQRKYGDNEAFPPADPRWPKATIPSGPREDI